jgi:hypothetical protein
LDLLSTGINALVLAVIGVVGFWYGRGRFDSIDGRFDAIDGKFGEVDAKFGQVEQTMDSRFGQVEQRLDSRFGQLESRMDAFQSSLDAMRSDLTQVALAVGVRGRASNA